MRCEMEAEWDAVRETAKELLDYADQLTEYAQGLLDIAAAAHAAVPFIGQKEELTNRELR